MSIRDSVIGTIRELVKLEGSQTSFAKKIGATKQAVGNWVNGANAPDIEMIAKIAETYGISMSDMLKESVSYHCLDIGDDGYVDVPVYGDIAAGKPIDMDEIDATFPVPRKIVDKYPDSGLLRVCGDSYNRTIPNGYLALVSFADKEPNERDPFAVCVNGHSATIKRVKRLSNGFELIPNSYDPTYSPTIYDYNQDDTDEITIIGKVVWAVMPFDYEI